MKTKTTPLWSDGCQSMSTAPNNKLILLYTVQNGWHVAEYDPHYWKHEIGPICWLQLPEVPHEKIETTLEERIERLEKLVDHLYGKTNGIPAPIPIFPLSAGECLMCGGIHVALQCPLLKPMSAT